jgi:phage protein D
MSAVPAARYYVPDCEIELGGRPLPADLRASMMLVRFEESLEGADRVELQFANQGLRLLDHPLFQLKAPLELSLGYRPDGIQPVFKGDVTGVEPVFPAGGMPTVTISAHDYMFRLTEGNKQRAFPWFLPDSVIAAIVAAENFLITEPDPISAAVGALNLFNQRPRYQYKQSDYNFMRGIAAEYGFDMWVDGDFMNFKFLIRELPPPQIELRWGMSLLEFSPRHTSIGELLAVTFKVWIQEIKTQLAIQAKWDGDTLSVRVMPALLAEMDETMEVTLGHPDIPLDTPVDAIKWVLGDLRRRINTRTTGKGTAIGDPRLRIGQVITLSGLGDEFSGSNYRLTSVSHTLDASGYRTGFEVRKELI